MKTTTPNPNPDCFTLDQLEIGDSGLVGQIGQVASKKLARIDHHLINRLMEIGFIPGEPLQVMHKGFFGGEPIAVRIGQSTFALRRFEAALISVVPHNKK